MRLPQNNFILIYKVQVRNKFYKVKNGIMSKSHVILINIAMTKSDGMADLIKRRLSLFRTYFFYLFWFILR